jgi:hypothetical protein
VSVHRDRSGWVVRWRDDGGQRALRVKTEAEALAFDEGVSSKRPSAGAIAAMPD